MTILVVDDEGPIRNFVARGLRHAGYITVTASDGDEALQVAAGSVDVLVTDMMMPHMTGAELARRLRQDQPALKVLYFTGYSDRVFDEKRTLWQDEAFLDKPCSMKAQLEAVALLERACA